MPKPTPRETRLRDQSTKAELAKQVQEYLVKWLEEYKQEIYRKLEDPNDRDTEWLKQQLLAANAFAGQLRQDIVQGKIAERSE